TYPYVGRQPGKDLWTDSTIALDANTGKLKWYYQHVHHDVWDYDTSNTPVLFNTKINGKTVKAIAQGNKDGYLFVLNRVNGSKLPNFPIPEVKPPSINGPQADALNNAWPTQPEPGGAAGQAIIHCPTADQAKDAFPTYPIAPNGLPMVATCQFASSYSDKYVVFGASHSAGINFPRMSFDPLTNNLQVCANNTMEA